MPLKPCPFCGGTEMRHNMVYGAVQCVRCEATGPAFPSSPDAPGKEAEGWNARAALEAREEPKAESFARDDVEAVADCLGDDAAQLREENDEDERATNMDRAASMLTWMLLTHPAYVSAASPVAAPVEARDAQTLGWIAVTDRLPDFGVPVWLYEDGRIFVGERSDDSDGWLWAKCYDSHYYDKRDGEWKSFSAETDDDYQPTHWMPLPPPPVAAMKEQPASVSPLGPGEDEYLSWVKLLERQRIDGVAIPLNAQPSEGSNA